MADDVSGQPTSLAGGLPGLWRAGTRYLRWFFRNRSAPVPNGPEYTRVRAQGGYFCFTVQLNYNWEAKTLSERAWAYQLWPRARRDLRNLLTVLGRRIPPHRPDELEEQVNHRLAGGREYREDGVLIPFHPQVYVFADDRASQHLKPFWDRRITLQSLYDLDVLRAKLADELIEQWSELLRKLLTEPLSQHAGKLVAEHLFSASTDANNPSIVDGTKVFAEVVSQLFDDHGKTGAKLVTLLEEAIRNHEKVGLGQYEFVETYDAALQELRQQLAAGPGGPANAA